MRIEIKNRFSGEVLFSHNCEENSIAITIEKAIKSSADLRSADLSSADLSSADLYGADLYGADLSSANLSSANLSSADLSSANLSSADLSSADLSSANLSSADLSSADLYGAKVPIYCKWNVSIIDNSIIKIGCKEKYINEWLEWFENSHEIFETDRNSDDFKRIRASFYAHKTYIENL